MQLNNSQLGAFVGCSVYDFVMAKKTRERLVFVSFFFITKLQIKASYLQLLETLLTVLTHNLRSFEDLDN